MIIMRVWRTVKKVNKTFTIESYVYEHTIILLFGIVPIFYKRKTIY